MSDRDCRSAGWPAGSTTAIDEASRAAYLDVPVAEAQAGHWPPPGPARFGETSPGTAPITVWKGFHDRFAAGVSLEQRAASAGSN